MALATQCPHCYTSFRVANDQLKLYGGMVRCGACKQTFNGIEHLIPPGSTPKLAPSIAMPDTVEPEQATSIEAIADQLPAEAEEAEEEAESSEELDLESNLRALLQEIKVRQAEEDAQEEAHPHSELASVQTTPVETPLAQDHTAQDAAFHLEVIETPEEPTPPIKKVAPKGLTASIDFDLDEDEQNAVMTPLAIDTHLGVEEINSMSTAIKPEIMHDDYEVDREEISVANINVNADSSNFAPDKEQSPRPDSAPPTLTPEHEDTPDFVLAAQRKQRYGKWTSMALSLGIVLGLFAAVAQSTYFFRHMIAAQYPQTKPYLLRLCVFAKCEIKLPAQRSQLEISGSELQILSNEPLINELNFQIQNRGRSPQTWPHLELILKDIRGKTVLQKTFAPALYLDNKNQVTNGIPGNSESAHKLNFELAIPKASSYTVELFYP